MRACFARPSTVDQVRRISSVEERGRRPGRRTHGEPLRDMTHGMAGLIYLRLSLQCSSTRQQRKETLGGARVRGVPETRVPRSLVACEAVFREAHACLTCRGPLWLGPLVLAMPWVLLVNVRAVSAIRRIRL